VSDEAPLLHKMDALLKKHRGDAEGAAVPPMPPAPAAPPSDVPPSDVPPPVAPPPDAPIPGWLPVLTQVIERGSPPDPQSAPPAAEDGPAIGPDAAASLIPDDEAALVERLMQALAPRLTEIMERQVAAALHRSLDQTVANLLAQLDVHVREAVLDTLADALKHPPE
jgi:hypothetical protein